MDADLGLGNLDVLLGLAPKYNLSHVIMEEKTIEDILIEGVCLLAVIYFYIGSYYEEKKLVNYFGDTYIKYQKVVSRIFPGFPLRAYDHKKVGG